MLARHRVALSVVSLGSLVATVLTPATGLAAPMPAAQMTADHGSWVPVGPMPTSRISHTLVRLPDGRVLSLGGSDGSDAPSCKRAADLYDPVSNTWSRAARMHQRRCGESAVVLRNGEVLVAGGDTWVYSRGTSLVRRSTEIFDPVTNHWSFTTPMHARRSGAVAALLPHGQVLLAGGDDLGSAEIYNPRTRRWHWTDSMPTAAVASARLRNGDVLVASCPASGGHLHRADRYVVRQHVWRSAGQYRASTCSPMPFRLPNGKVMAIDGRQVHRYNPTTNRWRLVAPLPKAVLNVDPVFMGSDMTVVAVDGMPMVLASGISCHVAHGRGLGYLWRPRLHQWVRWTTMPRPLVGSATQHLRDGSTLVTGGQDRLPPSCLGSGQLPPTRYAYRYYPNR